MSTDDKEAIQVIAIVIASLIWRMMQVINAVTYPVCIVWVVQHIARFGWSS